MSECQKEEKLILNGRNQAHSLFYEPTESGEFAAKLTIECNNEKFLRVFNVVLYNLHGVVDLAPAV